MTIDKRKRGRPPGTGKDDSGSLQAIADWLVENPTARPTTAIRRLHPNASDSDVRRLQSKWKLSGSTCLESAQRRSFAGQTSPPVPSRRGSAADPRIAAFVDQARRIDQANRIANELFNTPAMKAMREIANSPAMRAMREAQCIMENSPTMMAMREAQRIIEDSPVMRALREVQNSPTMMAMREAQRIIEDDPTMRALRELENNPVMQAVRSQREHLDRINRLLGELDGSASRWGGALGYPGISN